MLTKANTHSLTPFQKHLDVLLLLVVSYLASFSRGKVKGESCISIWFSIRLDPLQERTPLSLLTSKANSWQLVCYFDIN